MSQFDPTTWNLTVLYDIYIYIYIIYVCCIVFCRSWINAALTCYAIFEVKNMYSRYFVRTFYFVDKQCLWNIPYRLLVGSKMAIIPYPVTLYFSYHHPSRRFIDFPYPNCCNWKSWFMSAFMRRRASLIRMVTKIRGIFRYTIWTCDIIYK